MILYKYRSLENFEHVLDIILNQRLYCSKYPELNVPFEGLFVTKITLTPNDFLKNGNVLPLLAKLPITYKKVNEAKDLINDEVDKIKICSLSSNLSDVRLWSYYADGHKGIVFEIDFSGLEKIYKVKYSEKLPWSSAGILGRLSPQEALSQKTKHWEFESEYRIIDNNQHLDEEKFFSIKDRIKAIYLGTRTPVSHNKLMKKIVQGNIPIYTTKINHKKVIVESDKLIEEQ